MPAITVRLDEPTPARPALQGSTPLSFQPTRKTSGSGLSKQHEVHEKETMPSIQLKTEPLSPPPRSAPSGPIRARVLAKSFDHDATESAAPAIPEPVAEPLPSIVIDGIPSEPVRTELEMPAQQGGPPIPAPRPSKPGAPTEGGRKPGGKNGKAEKARAKEKEAKAEKTSERQVPKVARPQAPVRTDTMVLSQVPDKASPGIPTKGGGAKWVWFAIPALALAVVAALIGFDVYTDRQQRQRAAEEAEVPEEPAPEPPEPKQPEVAAPEPTEAPVPKVEAPRKKPGPGKQPAKAGGTPGETAMRSLQGDFEKLVEESVQRKFRLQVNLLEGQLDDKGSDPAFVKKVEALHDQVKTALAKEQ